MKRLLPYDNQWANIFEIEKIRLKTIIGNAVIQIHHIGSTSIPAMPAKPIIDILAAVSSFEALEFHNLALERIGYEARGEYGIVDRRYYKKHATENNLGFHLHAYLENSFQVNRHLAFRDYLKLKPEIAQKYVAIKEQYCDADGILSADYQLAKKPFVDALSLEAMEYFKPR